MKVVEGLKLNKFEYVAVPSRRQFYNRLTDAKISQYTSEKVDGVVDFSNTRKTDLEAIRMQNNVAASLSDQEQKTD